MTVHDLTDNCPRCLARDVPPDRQAEDYNGNTHTGYCCSACGWTWKTCRVAPIEESRYTDHGDPDAWEAEDDFSDYDNDRGTW